MNPDAARLIRDALEDVQNGVRTLDPVTEIDIVLTAAGYMIVPMRPTAAMVERMRECARLQTMPRNFLAQREPHDLFRIGNHMGRAKPKH